MPFFSITMLYKITRIEYLTLDVSSETKNGKILSNVITFSDTWLLLTILEDFIPSPDVVWGKILFI